MSDIDLYTDSASSYDDLQHKRPDYSGALKNFEDTAVRLLTGKENIVIADFCCGTGSNTKTLAQRLPVSKAILIDINRDFLNMAQRSKIQAEIKIVEGDIIEVSLKEEADLVISMFAYHHVPDDKKLLYIEQVKSVLKPGGILLLGEIYSPDKETTIKYYDNLINSIDSKIRTKELEKFLKQTAESDDFEYKVSREFAHGQLVTSGFVLVEEKKIWPNGSILGESVGTFVEVWQIK
jgi:ubiquinone/menaquinone biosynthesis C-methylase UbiE